MKFLTLLLLFSCSNVFAIYGEDDRKDYLNIDSSLKPLTETIAKQIYFDELKGWMFFKHWQLLISNLTIRNNVCSSEKFSSQPIVRNHCSGILITNKHLLLPGNCITRHYCSNDLFYWMFDYRMDSNDESFNVKRPRKKFYKCKKVITRVFNRETVQNYAIIELNKTVVDREPIEVNLEKDLKIGDEQYVIGFPKGLPVKLDDGVYVGDEEDHLFIVNTDIHGEDLGSAVINKKTKKLEGMMIYGSSGYTHDENCNGVNIYNNDEQGELAIKPSYITELKTLLKLY
jgi:hypothetical protein